MNENLRKLLNSFAGVVLLLLTIYAVAGLSTWNKHWKAESALKAARAVSTPGLRTELTNDQTTDLDIAQQRTKIVTELEGLGTHDWAGMYAVISGRVGDPPPYQEYIVTPTQACYRGSMRSDQNYGSVTVQEGRLRVDWMVHQHNFLGQASDFLVVKWGERRYLMPVSRLMQFVEEYHRRGPSAIWSYALVRRDDKEKAAGNDLVMPTGYEKYLTMGPITATITQANEPKQHGNRGPGSAMIHYRQTVVIDKGARHGVLEQMQLLTVGSRIMIHITRVEENQAYGIADIHWNVEGPPRVDLKVGQTLTTQLR